MNDQPLVPPPPPVSDTPASISEVSIRTMASDLASVAGSGGGAPRPTIETVAAAAKERAVRAGKRSLIFVWAVAAVVGGAVLFLLGYYLIPLFAPKPAPSSSGVAPPAAAPALSTSTAPAPASFVHQSFFRTPAQETVVVKLAGATTAEGLQSYSQRLAALLAEKPASSTFFEISVQKADGSQPAWAEFSFLIDAGVLDSKTVNEKFNPDFTAFVYRDKTGLWPGYLLKLKTGQTAVKPDISEIERASSTWTNFFFAPPGVPASGFQDVQISGQPFRSLSFANSSATLKYGWIFGNYLAISASEGGLKEAIRHF